MRTTDFSKLIISIMPFFHRKKTERPSVLLPPIWPPNCQWWCWSTRNQLGNAAVGHQLNGRKWIQVPFQGIENGFNCILISDVWVNASGAHTGGIICERSKPIKWFIKLFYCLLSELCFGLTLELHCGKVRTRKGCQKCHMRQPV